MKVKSVIPREQANRDVDDAVACYLGEAVALGFIDALELVYIRYPDLTAILLTNSEYCSSATSVVSK